MGDGRGKREEGKGEGKHRWTGWEGWGRAGEEVRRSEGREKREKGNIDGRMGRTGEQRGGDRWSDDVTGA